jgi:NAD(P)H-flavin reductase
VLDPASDRDLLLVAGGTGLAPLKAVVEQLIIENRRRRVHLFHGARTFPGLYDRADLDALAAQHDWLTVTYALSEYSHTPDVQHGSVAEVVTRVGHWQDFDVVVCGSPRMVERTVPMLAQTGIPSDRIRFDEFAAR